MFFEVVHGVKRKILTHVKLEKVEAFIQPYTISSTTKAHGTPFDINALFFRKNTKRTDKH